MRLISKLLKFFLVLDDTKFNMKHYHEETQYMDKYSTMHSEELVNFARKMINSIDLLNYKIEEERVYCENFSCLKTEFLNDDFATTISKALMFTRTALLYVSVSVEGISFSEMQKIISKLKMVEELVVYAVLKKYKDNGIEVLWNGFDFVFSFKCLSEDMEIFDLAKQIVWLNDKAKKYMENRGLVEFIQLLDCLKVKNIISGKSKQAYYDQNTHV